MENKLLGVGIEFQDSKQSNGVGIEFQDTKQSNQLSKKLVWVPSKFALSFHANKFCWGENSKKSNLNPKCKINK